MKTITPIIFGMLLFQGLFSEAQEKNHKPTYWVVESNFYSRDKSIVRLYDAQDQLVHEVKFEDKYIDVNKRKHKRMLNDILKKYTERAATSGKRHKSKVSI
jgi:hypothetical protein